jgi:hypothetical protein
MSEDEVQQTILRAVQGRGEARKDLITLNRRLGEISRQLTDIAMGLSSLPSTPDLGEQETLVRKLRDLPDGKQIGAMIIEHAELTRRIHEAGEYLRLLGVEG